MIALLGLAAVAGYQNRGKISELINGAGADQPRLAPSTPSAAGGFLAELGHMFRSDNLGNTLSGGLGDLVNQLKSAGQAHTADSWVSSGSNLPVQGDKLEAALGDQTLSELEAKTGLSRSELLQRLTNSLPDMVDQLTPRGRLPTPSEAAQVAAT